MQEVTSRRDCKFWPCMTVTPARGDDLPGSLTSVTARAVGMRCRPRQPRFTCRSDGKPRRRLLIGSKKMAVRQTVLWTWDTILSIDVHQTIDRMGNKGFAVSPVADRHKV